jgi:sugar phosphate isomerase/epimerase
MFEALKEAGYEIEFVSHAEAILEKDFPDAVSELEATLREVDIPITEIIGSGGGEAKGTQRLRRSLAARHWKVNFEIKKTINGIERESISHEVDHVRTFERNQLVAPEIEWNNKDPFFDRDRYRSGTTGKRG